MITACASKVVTGQITNLEDFLKEVSQSHQNRNTPPNYSSRGSFNPTSDIALDREEVSKDLEALKKQLAQVLNSDQDLSISINAVRKARYEEKLVLQSLAIDRLEFIIMQFGSLPTTGKKAWRKNHLKSEAKDHLDISLREARNPLVAPMYIDKEEAKLNVIRDLETKIASLEKMLSLGDALAAPKQVEQSI